MQNHRLSLWEGVGFLLELSSTSVCHFWGVVVMRAVTEKVIWKALALIPKSKY